METPKSYPIIYIPDASEEGMERSALALAFPDDVLTYTSRTSVYDQLRDYRYSETTTVVVHGTGWSFFKQARVAGYFASVKHLIVLAAKEILIPFSNPPKMLKETFGVITLHAIPDGHALAEFSQSDIVRSPSNKIVLLKNMHPNMREVWSPDEKGHVTVKEFTTTDLQKLVKKLMGMVDPPIETISF